jgi:hypothetical protein
MKKTALTISLLLALLFVLGANVRAQTFDFNKAYQDYQFSLGTYQSAYSAYEASKDFYLTNQTLTLKEDVRKKTLLMLKERDQLTAVYLTMLRMKIVETKGISNDDKATVYGRIDPEVKWYQEHLKSYQDGDPLEDLFSKSKEVEGRYKATTLPIIYDSLFNISLGAEVGMQGDMSLIYSDLKGIVDARVTSGNLDMNPFNRWFTDIDALIQTLNKNNELAKTQIAKVYGQYFSLLGAYNTSTGTLESSKTSLAQLNNFLIEVLTSLKNQQ